MYTYQRNQENIIVWKTVEKSGKMIMEKTGLIVKNQISLYHLHTFFEVYINEMTYRMFGNVFDIVSKETN